MAYRSYRRDVAAAEELVEMAVAAEVEAEEVAADRRRKKQRQKVCPRSVETIPRNRRRKF